MYTTVARAVTAAAPSTYIGSCDRGAALLLVRCSFSPDGIFWKGRILLCMYSAEVKGKAYLVKEFISPFTKRRWGSSYSFAPLIFLAGNPFRGKTTNKCVDAAQCSAKTHSAGNKLTIPHHTMPHHTIPYYTTPHHIALHHTTQQHNTRDHMNHSTTQHSNTTRHTTQHSITHTSPRNLSVVRGAKDAILFFGLSKVSGFV